MISYKKYKMILNSARRCAQNNYDEVKLSQALRGEQGKSRLLPAEGHERVNSGRPALRTGCRHSAAAAPASAGSTQGPGFLPQSEHLAQSLQIGHLSGGVATCTSDRLHHPPAKSSVHDALRHRGRRLLLLLLQACCHCWGPCCWWQQQRGPL